MTKDEILLALRMTAMGRSGHPSQEQLAEELARVLAPAPAEPAPRKARATKAD